MTNENYKTSNDKMICALTAFMFASFFIFELYSWGKYLFLAITATVAFIHFRFSRNESIKIVFENFQIRLLYFAIFCFASALWAWVPSSAFQSGLTIIEILLCYSMFYEHFKQKDNIGSLFTAIKWGANIVIVYTIVYYGGLFGIATAATISELRLENGFSNINELGMLAAIVCILQLNDYYQRKKISWDIIFVIPAILVVAASQSRKAFVLLILGILLLMIFKNIGQSFSVYSLYRIIIVVIVFGAGVLLIFNSGLFSGTLGRFTEDAISSSNSSLLYNPNTLRGIYKLVGWKQFLKTPLLGIGMGSSARMIHQNVGISTYTHDNYIELLSSGGLLGFTIYYSIYAFLLRRFIKFRKLDPEYSDICLVLLLLLLIADTALVSFSSKERYMYLMLMFIETERINNYKTEME